MDHWRLDADDAAFEDARQERDKQLRAEAARLHEESSQFYQLARASQEKSLEDKRPPPSTIHSRGIEKRKQQQAPRLNCVKVLKAAPKNDQPKTHSPAPAATVACLPGMDAYSDDSDGDK